MQKYCSRIFSGVGWSMNSAMGPTKKNANAETSLRKRTLRKNRNEIYYTGSTTTLT